MTAKSVIVIGGGPAGMMAAGTAASRGHDVTLIEKNTRAGRKLAITGNGRCNITHLGDVDDLMKGIVRNREFLKNAFYSLSGMNLMGFFLGLGLHTYVDDSGRVYPESEKAEDVVDSLLGYMKKNKVRILRDSAVGITYQDGRITGVIMKDKRIEPCSCVIVATGGMSYPSTGSTGDGYDIARMAGHGIIDPRPCLVPFDLKENIHMGLQGVSLAEVWIEISDTYGKWISGRKGDVIFTHFGISGPAVIKISGDIPPDCSEYKLTIDLRPEDAPDEISRLLIGSIQENPRRSILNTMSLHFPKRIAGSLIQRCGIDPGKLSNQISKTERRSLQNMIKKYEMTIAGMRSIEEAIITAGGVETAEIDPETMGSTMVKGLYFAGEVIDVHGTTGGYNLQIAFSTGYLAGMNC